jgi:hypothetical protein
MMVIVKRSLMALPAIVMMAIVLAEPQAADGHQQPEPQPSIENVLERAARYAIDFKRRLSGIVAEEDYVQDIDVFTRLKPEVMHRELKSDLLLVRPADIDRYVEFRDVAEVDGRAVRDRQERLTNLFLDPRGSNGQLQKIIAESARYNIGKVVRNVNTPLLALMFLDPDYQSRFTFTIAVDRTPSLARRSGKPGDTASPNFSVATEVWVVEYEEAGPRTIIRTPEGRDMPARGRFWLDPVSGRLLMTELVAGDSSLRATINVSYQSEPLLGFSVPVEMRERYDAPDLIISGTATYRNFRQFDVKVEEIISPGKF